MKNFIIKSKIMNPEQNSELTNKIIHALEIAEYETLKKKAMLNQNVVVEDENGDPIVVPAREVFVEMFNEPVPTF